MVSSISNRERVSAWCRGKSRLIVFTLCIAFVLVFVGISLGSRATPESNLESFDCHFFSNSQTFSIEVEVELSDGMDQGEAIRVAASALNEVLFVNSEEQIGSFRSSADLGHDGFWTVRLMWTRRGRLHDVASGPGTGAWTPIYERWPTESFEAIIDPINRIVKYGFV